MFLFYQSQKNVKPNQENIHYRMLDQCSSNYLYQKGIPDQREHTLKSDNFIFLLIAFAVMDSWFYQLTFLSTYNWS